MHPDFKFRKLSKKHKFAFMSYMIFLFIFIVSMGYTALKMLDINILKPEDQMNITFGAIIIGLLIIMSSINRLKQLLKFKSTFMIAIFLVALCLQSIVEIVVVGAGLLIIPLLMDDFVQKIVWNRIWEDYYE